MDSIQILQPTSKASLKQQCLICCNGDVERARALYDFYIEGMDDLPMFDPVPPTWQQNTAKTVNGVVSWLKENQGTLVQGYQFIQQLLSRKGAVIEEVAEALPSINEE